MSRTKTKTVSVNTISEKQAILIKICQEPKEDTHRLVYADYIEEYEGNTNYANYIRWSIELDKYGPPHKKVGWEEEPIGPQIVRPAGPDYVRWDIYGNPDQLKKGDRVDIRFQYLRGKVVYEWHGVEILTVKRDAVDNRLDNFYEVIARRNKDSKPWGGEAISKKLAELVTMPVNTDYTRFDKIARTFVKRGFIYKLRCQFKEFFPFIPAYYIYQKEYSNVNSIQPIEEIEFYTMNVIIEQFGRLRLVSDVLAMNNVLNRSKYLYPNIKFSFVPTNEQQ